MSIGKMRIESQEREVVLRAKLLNLQSFFSWDDAYFLRQKGAAELVAILGFV